MNANPQAERHSPSKWPLLPILLGLDAFVLGGLAALLSVNRLLWRAADSYAPRDMRAASVVLDLIDDLLAYLAPCAVLLFFLVLITVALAVWRKARSRTVRYGVAALVMVVLLLSAASIGTWILRAMQPPSIAPTTPTPLAPAATQTPAVGALWGSPYGAAHTAMLTRATSSSTTICRSASAW